MRFPGLSWSPFEMSLRTAAAVAVGSGTAFCSSGTPITRFYLIGGWKLLKAKAVLKFYWLLICCGAWLSVHYVKFLTLNKILGTKESQGVTLNTAHNWGINLGFSKLWDILASWNTLKVNLWLLQILIGVGTCSDMQKFLKSLLCSSQALGLNDIEYQHGLVLKALFESGENSIQLAPKAVRVALLASHQCSVTKVPALSLVGDFGPFYHFPRGGLCQQGQILWWTLKEAKLDCFPCNCLLIIVFLNQNLKHHHWVFLMVPR